MEQKTRNLVVFLVVTGVIAAGIFLFVFLSSPPNIPLYPHIRETYSYNPTLLPDGWFGKAHTATGNPESIHAWYKSALENLDWIVKNELCDYYGVENWMLGTVLGATNDGWATVVAVMWGGPDKCIIFVVEGPRQGLDDAIQQFDFLASEPF